MVPSSFDRDNGGTSAQPQTNDTASHDQRLRRRGPPGDSSERPGWRGSKRHNPSEDRPRQDGRNHLQGVPVRGRRVPASAHLAALFVPVSQIRRGDPRERLEADQLYAPPLVFTARHGQSQSTTHCSVNRRYSSANAGAMTAVDGLVDFHFHGWPKGHGD
jgi:hypothetical protein